MTLTLDVKQNGIMVHPHTNLRYPRLYTFLDVNFGLVNFGQVTDREKAMHKSPPCIRTENLILSTENLIDY